MLNKKNIILIGILLTLSFSVLTTIFCNTDYNSTFKYDIKHNPGNENNLDFRNQPNFGRIQTSASDYGDTDVEPNNDFTGAEGIYQGYHVGHVNSTDRDDYYQITKDEGLTFRVQLQFDTIVNIPSVSIYNGSHDLQQVFHNDEIVEFELNKSEWGWVYLRIYDTYNTPGGVNYSFYIQNGGATFEDGSEEDDFVEIAEISPRSNRWIHGCYANDSDWKGFYLHETEEIDISLYSLSKIADINISLYQGNVTPSIIANSTNTTNIDTLTYTAGSSDWYYLMINSSDNGVFYSIHYEIISPISLEDVFEPNNEIATATELHLSQKKTNLWLGDSDFYKVMVQKDIQVHIRMSYLYQDFEFEFNTEIGGVLGSYSFNIEKETYYDFAFTPNENGFYYFSISPYFSSGNYSIEVWLDEDSYEDNDDLSSATLLDLGVNNQTKISDLWLNGNDWFKIYVDIADIINITIDGFLNGTSDFNLYIYNQSNDLLGYKISGYRASVAFNNTYSGFVYCKVFKYSGSALSYNITAFTIPGDPESTPNDDNTDDNKGNGDNTPTSLIPGIDIIQLFFTIGTMSIIIILIVRKKMIIF